METVFQAVIIIFMVHYFVSKIFGLCDHTMKKGFFFRRQEAIAPLIFEILYNL